MANPLRSESIKRFLVNNTHPDLAALYTSDMEVQVMVAQDAGRKVHTGDFKGKNWQTFEDPAGVEKWYSFRIPKNADKEPENNDMPMSYDLASHVEGIGMTGWNWVRKESIYLGFDFDAIIGHSEKHQSKLTEDELKSVQDAIASIPWCTLRRSTSGNGLHVYVELEPTPTQNHTEHKALARAVLAQMAVRANFDFVDKVDAFGGVLWIWHRKMLKSGGIGLKLLKQATELYNPPAYWQDHIDVIKRTRKKLRQSWIPKEGGKEIEDAFEAVTSQMFEVPLDDRHRQLLKWLEENHAVHRWDPDHHCLVTHTTHLKDAHMELGMKGVFETISTGKDKGSDWNCYAHPMKNGAWVVRRFTQGTVEHPLWEQDGSGWTRCYLNVLPDLQTAARMNKGIYRSDEEFAFDNGYDAIQAAAMLGAKIEIPPHLQNWANSTKVILKTDKGGRQLKVHFEKKSKEEGLPGWDNGKTFSKRVFKINIPTTKPESEVVENMDDIIRHLIRDQGNKGWVLFNGSDWQDEPLEHIKHLLRGPMQKEHWEMQAILGTCIRKAWTLCNMPFKAEYPGGRLWNRNAAQLAFVPTPGQDILKYDHWLRVLQHCGQSLDHPIKENEWCQQNGILTGADYLKCWIANLFKEPTAPLPYLFFYGPENSGKSIFHEAIAMLLTAGYARADTALMSQGNFNGELENAIIAVIEETDLKKNRAALEKIKDWVTAPKIFIHKKNVQPYMAVNTLHFVQCANNIEYCPIFPGDSRITVIFVPEIDPDNFIPKRELEAALRKEAPDFLAAILALELPVCPDRLNLPVIETEEKKEAAEAANETPLTAFLEARTFERPGETILYKEFFEELKNFFYKNNDVAIHLGKNKIAHELRCRRMLAHHPETNQLHVINRSFEPRKEGEQLKPRLVIRGRGFYSEEKLNGNAGKPVCTTNDGLGVRLGS